MSDQSKNKKGFNNKKLNPFLFGNGPDFSRMAPKGHPIIKFYTFRINI